MSIIGTQHTGHKKQVLICENCSARVERNGMQGLRWCHEINAFAKKHAKCDRGAVRDAGGEK